MRRALAAGSVVLTSLRVLDGFMACRGALRLVIKILARGTLIPDLSSFLSKNLDLASMTSTWWRRNALIHSFISWNVGADIIMGAIVALAQKINRKVNGFLDSYIHYVNKCKVGKITYRFRDLLKDEIMEWLEVLGLQIVFFLHLFDLKVDQTGIGKDNESLLPAIEESFRLLVQGADLSDAGEVVPENLLGEC